MVANTCFGITLPSSGSVPSAFWEMLNWGAVDRILRMDVLCLVTWCVAIWPSAFREMLNWGAVDRILWMGILFLATWWACAPRHWTQHVHPQYSIDCSSIEYLSEGTRNAPWLWQSNAKTCRCYHTKLINWTNNWCICWFFTYILLGILIFKGLTALSLYKSFGVKGLIR
jgi:hypothetical protein